MLRIKNLHTSAIDDIAKGAEGVMPDNKHVRAMVDAGMIEVIGVAEGDDPSVAGAPARDLDAAQRDPNSRAHITVAELGSLVDELERARAQLAQVSADRDDLAARLEASEAARAALETAHAASLAAADKGAGKADKSKDKG